MDKLEFEKRFMKIAKDKFDTRASWDNALRDLLKFIDDHKIYEYKSYEMLLSSLQSTRLNPNATNYLNGVGAKGMFALDTSQIFLIKKHHERQNNPRIFIHELLHALSFERKEFFDCQIFKKQTTPEIPMSIFGTPINGEVDEEDLVKVYEWWEKNGNLLADAKKSIPLRVESKYGFVCIEEEFSELINARKIREKTRSTADYERLEKGKLGKTQFASITTKDSFLLGLTEGATELFATMVTSKSSPEKMRLTCSYNSNTMLCAQLYAIFGEKFFEGFWTHSLSPMCKKLDLDENKFSDIVKLISRIDCSQKDDETILNMMFTSDVQIEFIKLFERKMLRELAKYRDDFHTPQDVRNAILSSFFDYSKLLHFGVHYEELLNPNIKDVWQQVESSIENCLAFGNKLLAKRGKSPMRAYDKNFLTAMKKQNYFTYDYISNNLREITLSDRLRTFKFNYVKPSLGRQETDALKEFHEEVPLGQLAHLLSRGVDQDLLRRYCDGEDIDINLLQPKSDENTK